MSSADQDGPLAGIRVVERSQGVAAAYAGRLLAAMGAEVVLAEPRGGSALRSEPPRLGDGEGVSALFAYLAAGKSSVVCDLDSPAGAEMLGLLLDGADIFIDDTPLDERERVGLDREAIARIYPKLVHVSVLPFGATGSKAAWKGHEVNLIHASGEGFLLPNGLSVELFPGRPPLKIYGHFTAMQGGTSAALGALSALWCAESAGGQFVDISVQDAGLAVGAFAVQRYGDGSVEHRAARSFRYGGVLECRDGFVELLTLEERQWTALVRLLGEPDWARDPALSDVGERSRRGDEINIRIRDWARSQATADLVARAQELGVPMAPYNTPQDVLHDPHERARGLFQPLDIPGVGTRDMLVAPFRFGADPLRLSGPAPALGQLASPDVERRGALVELAGAAE